MNNISKIKRLENLVNKALRKEAKIYVLYENKKTKQFEYGNETFTKIEDVLSEDYETKQQEDKIKTYSSIEDFKKEYNLTDKDILLCVSNFY